MMAVLFDARLSVQQTPVVFAFFDVTIICLWIDRVFASVFGTRQFIRKTATITVMTKPKISRTSQRIYPKTSLHFERLDLGIPVLNNYDVHQK